MSDIQNKVLANQIAWVALVEELYHNGYLNKQNLKNRIDSMRWMQCGEDLAVYSIYLENLDKTAKTVEVYAYQQDNGNNNQGIISSPNSNISNSFNQ